MCEWQASGSCMKRLALFVDGTHNDTWQQNNYYDVLGRFLSEVVITQGSTKCTSSSGSCSCQGVAYKITQHLKCDYSVTLIFLRKMFALL